MRAEHLCQWLREGTREKDPDGTQWLKVVAIVQTEFRNGTLSSKSTWQKLVLILKGGGIDFRGIGLVEVL